MSYVIGWRVSILIGGALWFSGCAITEKTSLDGERVSSVSMEPQKAEENSLDRFFNVLGAIDGIASGIKGDVPNAVKSTSLGVRNVEEPSYAEKAINDMAESAERASSESQKSAVLAGERRDELISKYRSGELDQRTFEMKMNAEINKERAESMRRISGVY